MAGILRAPTVPTEKAAANFARVGHNHAALGSLCRALNRRGSGTRLARSTPLMERYYRASGDAFAEAVRQGAAAFAEVLAVP
jgi:hypothetical protein